MIELKEKKVSELREELRKLKLPVSGNKEELIKRILKNCEPRPDQNEDSTQQANTTASDVRAKYSDMTVAQLRTILKKRKLPIAGKKEELINRLITSFIHVDVLPPPPDNTEDTVCAKYGGMTIPQLRAVLKERNASLKGKKKDLIDRLVYYDKNSNFVVRGEEPDIELDDLLQLPDMACFKDVHAGSPVPQFNKKDIELYLSRFHIGIEKGERMYENGYLKYARYCNKDGFTFISGSCSAELKKYVAYNVYVKLTGDGEVEGCQCECTAGHSGEAHCKHVVVLLLAIAQVKTEGIITTELSCTQQLQTFHHPTKKFKGTPLKAFQLKKTKETVNNNDTIHEEAEEDSTQEEVLAYRAWFRNILINGGFNSTMPLKTLIQPANPFAILNDHCYSSVSTEDILLNHFMLKQISAQEAQDIEEKTRGQSTNNLWHELRETHITASRFYEVTRDTNPESRAQRILYPQKFSSRATSHGIKYESVAIEKYKQENPNCDVKVSGLTIMESHPFLAASPDFLIDLDGVGEVKCPYTARKALVSPNHLPFLRWSKKCGTTMKMKKTHQYYYQVQGLLMVTGRMYCDFVVYTFKNMVTIRVERKENFITLLLFRLCDFFSLYFKPALLNKYLWRNYDKYKFKLECYCTYCSKIPVK